MHSKVESAAVKVVFEWRVVAGARVAFERWLTGFVAAATAAPGYEGSSVFSSHEDWLVLLRFADAAALAAWQAAPSTRERLAAASSLASGGRSPQQRSGLETWFTLPGHAPAAPPPRWKMALVTWCALLPQVLLLGELMPRELPPIVRTMVGTLVPVAMLTWVVMPWLTRLLAHWLYPVRSA